MKKKLDIGHFQQSQKNTCGAASLAMIYQYLGIENQNEGVIWERLKVPRKNGAPGEYILKTKAMAEDCSQFDLSYFYAQAILKDPEIALQPIREFLKSSIPVVVCQKISSENHLGHFRVVRGIDKNFVYVNDPDEGEGNTKIALGDFLPLWEEASNGKVVGGEFFAIFKKEKLRKKSRFQVREFTASIDSFTVSSLHFD